MSDDSIERTVFDCNVFAQALITPSGSSSLCIDLVLDGRLRLFWSAYVLNEIRRLPERPTPKKLGVTDEVVEKLVARLQPIAYLVQCPDSVYQHPIDPKDSHYIDLAVAADAKWVVSSDKHLLNLANRARQESAEFVKQFPKIEILQPWEFLNILRSRGLNLPS